MLNITFKQRERHLKTTNKNVIGSDEYVSNSNLYLNLSNVVNNSSLIIIDFEEVILLIFCKI